MNNYKATLIIHVGLALSSQRIHRVRFTSFGPSQRVGDARA